MIQSIPAGIPLIVASMFLCAGTVFGHDKSDYEPETHVVDCGQGDTVAAAMQRAKPGDTIMVNGVCNESVEITKDDITLSGIGLTGGVQGVIDGSCDPVIFPEIPDLPLPEIPAPEPEMPPDGIVGPIAFCDEIKPAIAMEGRSRIVIQDLTVRGGATGIKIVNNSNAHLQRVNVVGNEGNGVEVFTNSSARIDDSDIMDNGGDGLQMVNSSSVYTSNSYYTYNGGNGVGIYNNSIFGSTSNDTGPSVRYNGQYGLSMWNGASADFYSASATITDNSMYDVGLWHGSRFAVGESQSVIGTSSCDRTAVVDRDDICN